MINYQIAYCELCLFTMADDWPHVSSFSLTWWLRYRVATRISAMLEILTAKLDYPPWSYKLHNDSNFTGHQSLSHVLHFTVLFGMETVNSSFENYTPALWNRMTKSKILGSEINWNGLLRNGMRFWPHGRKQYLLIIRNYMLQNKMKWPR